MEVQQQQQQQWIKKHNSVSQISELLDQYLHQSTGSFALNPKLPITASSSSSADSSTYLAWESERRNWKFVFTAGFQMIKSAEAAASALVSPFTELDWVSLEI
jgi:adenosine deaminase